MKKMNLRKTLLILLFVLATAMSSSTDEPDTHLEHGDAKLLEDQKEYRDGKVLNVFTVVTFPNDSCIGSGSRNGTCYTEAECNSKGGTQSGSCAQGFGTCCVFVAYCGSTTSENCTYFESAGTAAAGQCSLEICPCRSGICQMRLDFTTFVISGPSTITITEVTLVSGAVTSHAAGVAANFQSNCLTDTFTVRGSGSGLNQPPIICGTNTGQHMYAEMDNNNCNTLDFQLGTTGVETTIPTRSWSIKITQISCTSDIRAPVGCTQYFYGGNTNTVQTYNWDSATGEHLANQQQNICVRQERGYCQICWSATDNLTFDVSGLANGMTGALGGVCCSYGFQGVQQTLGYDCLFIPGAKNGVISAEFANSIGGNRFCGHEEGLVTGSGAAAIYATGVPTQGAEGTICTKNQPFSIQFVSDGFEMAIANGESAVNAADTSGSGFELGYFLNNQGC